MFGFLKDKLKSVVDSIKKGVEEVVETKEVEVEAKPKAPAKKVEKKEIPVKPKIGSADEVFKKSFNKKKEKRKSIVDAFGTKEEEKKESPKKKPSIFDDDRERDVKTIPVNEEERIDKDKKLDEEGYVDLLESDKEENKSQKDDGEDVFQELDLINKGKIPIEEELVDAQSSETASASESDVLSDPKEEPKEEKKGFFGKLFGKKEETVKKEEVIEETEEPKEKVGFFRKLTETVTKFNLSEQKFNDLFWELEVTLLENNVAVEVIEKIKKDLKEELTTGKISRKGVEEVIRETLRKSIEEVLDIPGFDLIKKAKGKKPFVIVFIGVNGSGKTTNMAKLAHMLQENGLSVVFAASDTFRAAAIQQLEEHANKLKIRMIKHDYNADPAAVAFDAIEHAKAKGIDVVMIDTAGRLHSNDNLMKELEKLVRVNKPDLKLFVGESITGNDCVEQARVYNEKIGIDGIILSKADVDEKGGAAISVSFITKKPILFIGTGQTYDDLTKFDKKLVLDSLGL